MPYCTATDIKNVLDNTLLAQLTAPSGTTPTDATLTQAAAYASTWIDSYLIGRYVVPVTNPTVLAVLVPHACWLSIANLFQDRLMLEQYKSFDDNSKDTQRFLEMIQAGKAALPGAAAQVLSESATGSMYDSPFINDDGSVTLP
jgi:phage gp36-like protein